MSNEEFDSLYPEIKSIMDELFIEIKKAMTKHPHWPTTDVIHAAAIVSEENGELIRAAVQLKYEGGTYEECRKEAIQTGAMAIRFLLNR